jgi:hypothetical protein
VREGSVYVQGLFGDALLFFGSQVLERPHVVEAIGQLNDDNPDIADHGEQHFANVFGLVVFAIGKLDFIEFGHALNDVGDLLAKTAANLLSGNVRVLDSIVEQAGSNRGGIHLEVGQDLRNFERMNDVRLT